MIARFFSKSKPIHLILIAIVFLLYLILALSLQNSVIEGSYFSLVSNIGILLFALLLFNFINSKNNLTQKNSYALFWFACFMAMIPRVYEHSNYIWSALFVLLAMRRLFSLHSKKDVKLKLFDSSFWITLAALFVPEASLFLIVVLIAVIYYSGNDIKVAVIPLIGISCVLVLKIIYNILFFDKYVLNTDLQLDYNLSFNPFVSWESGLRFVFILSFLIWSVFDLLLSLKDRPAALKPIYLLVLWSSLLAFSMGIISAQEDGSQWIYLSFSWAFLQAFNTERRDKLWVKNLMLYSGLSVLILLLIVL